MKPADIARLGLVRSFQISAVFPHLTVLENVRIALQRRRGDSFDFWRSEKVLRRARPRRRSRWSRRSACPTSPTFAAVELSYGRKRALEIATTLALDPEMLLLDEPMAGMGHEDIDRIAAADPPRLGEPHHPDGRAQPLGRRLALGPHHGAGARQDAGRGRLRHRVEGPARDRGLYRSPVMAEAPPRSHLGPGRDCAAPRGARPARLVRRVAMCCTGSTSTLRRARSSPCSAATAPARPRP